ncbi:MAG: phage major capsid protein, partial [Trueperaceae bacterium]|nr:phage major capsid protein [Trueperaceae bacterium]
AAEQRSIDEFLQKRGIERNNLSTAAQRRATPEYARNFRKFLGATTMEERSLSAGLDSEGGYTVLPIQMAAGLIKAADDMVFVRQYASKETVEGAAALGMTTLEADPADADWTTELQTGDEDSTMAFGKREQQPHPFAKRIKISKKLIRASTRNIESLVFERLGYKSGVTEEKGFLTGNGNQRPLGIYTASADGVTTARDVSADNTATEITGDGLINAKFALKGQYLREARWNFHRDAVKQITKLKDQNDQYLWLPSLREGEPDRILGIPYDMSEFAPNTFTTGQYVGALCAWRYYQIVDALGMTIQVLTELYAETNQNGYILRKETDGAPVLAEAFVRVKLA